MAVRTGVRILVPFHGEGAGVGELTWGQKGIWQTIRASGESKTMGGVDPLPPGATVGRAIAALQYVLGRHQSLRTRLRFDADGYPQQVVSSSGEVPVEIVDADGADDPAQVAEEVRDRYQGENFDYAHEWPVRMALVCRDGRPTHAVAIYLHLALDAQAMDLVMADSTTVDGAGGPPPLNGIQPLELAALQALPAAQRQCDASLRHLERMLRVAPRRFGPATAGSEPLYQMLGYRSRAALLAVRAVAARIGMGTTPVLLAAFAVALARRTGVSPVVTVLAVSNRFRPGFAASVSPVAQVSPCLIDVAGISLTDAVRRAARSAMQAYKHAYYDPDRRAELIERVNRERGEEVDISCFFNDRRQQGREQTKGPLATDLEIRQAMPASELRWITRPGLPQQKIYLDVDDAPGAVDLSLSADTRYLSPPDMVAFIREMEAVAVVAALDPAAGTGVEPPGAGAG
jgi:hypothetical protein